MKGFARVLTGLVAGACSVGLVLGGIAASPVHADTTLTLKQAQAQLADLQKQVDALQTQMEASDDKLNEALVEQATLQDQVAAQQKSIDALAPAFANMVNAQRQSSTLEASVRFLLTDDTATFMEHLGVTANVKMALDEQMTLLGDEKQRLTDTQASLDQTIATVKAESAAQADLLKQQQAAEAKAQAVVDKLTAAQRAKLPASVLGPGVQPQTKHLVEVITGLFPQIKNVGTLRAGSTGDHGKGLAADFMIPNYKQNVALGWQIANYAKSHASELKVKYIIWQQSIWQTAYPSKGWKPMADRGSDNQNHKNHVHISLYP